MAQTPPSFDLDAAGFNLGGIMDGVQVGLNGVGLVVAALAGISIGIGWMFKVGRKGKGLAR